MSAGDGRDGGGEGGSGGPVWAVGLMSGTSMDGVDAALVRTDGHTVADVGPSLTAAYDEDLRGRLREAVSGRAGDAAVRETEIRLTRRHADAVAELLAGWDGAEAPRVVGFHGHTLWHRPREHRTCQIGDGAMLARLAGLPVVNDFRAADMAAGGEGAPFAPLYHLARMGGCAAPLPVAVLNLGGVANVTWIGGRDMADEARLLAFDTGPGCALLDDWAYAHTGVPCDVGGALAAAGRVDEGALATLLDHPYFDRPPPKSLDRHDFDPAPVADCTVVAGAATLTAFTARAVALAARRLPAPPVAWYATGGGRHNTALMAALAGALGVVVQPVEVLGWDGDTVEAEAFGFLAVRSLRGLPLSLPGTTGVARPVTGGRLHRPEA